MSSISSRFGVGVSICIVILIVVYIVFVVLGVVIYSSIMYCWCLYYDHGAVWGGDKYLW